MDIFGKLVLVPTNAVDCQVRVLYGSLEKSVCKAVKSGYCSRPRATIGDAPAYRYSPKKSPTSVSFKRSEPSRIEQVEFVDKDSTTVFRRSQSATNKCFFDLSNEDLIPSSEKHKNDDITTGKLRYSNQGSFQLACEGKKENQVDSRNISTNVAIVRQASAPTRRPDLCPLSAYSPPIIPSTKLQPSVPPPPKANIIASDVSGRPSAISPPPMREPARAKPMDSFKNRFAGLLDRCKSEDGEAQRARVVRERQQSQEARSQQVLRNTVVIAGPGRRPRAPRPVD